MNEAPHREPLAFATIGGDRTCAYTPHPNRGVFLAALQPDASVAVMPQALATRSTHASATECDLAGDISTGPDLASRLRHKAVPVLPLIVLKYTAPKGVFGWVCQ